MPEGSFELSSRRVLEPIDRVSEVLFGLIMVLTFTGSLSIAEAGRSEVRTMLIGALGCNLAWGIIDGVLYLMGCLAEKGRGLLTFRAVRRAADPKEAQRVIADALPSVVASVLEPVEMESLYQRLKQLPEPPHHARLRKDDWLGAVGVFLLVFLCTFPVVIPFIFMHNAGPALRVSNAIAIVMLFLTGYAFGRMTGRQPCLVCISMVVLGLVTISAAAKNWSGNSRRCWAACSAIRLVSRRATSCRLLTGSSSFPVKASLSSTRAIQRETSSTPGLS